MLSNSSRLEEAWTEWRFLFRSRWSTCLLIASAVFLGGAWWQKQMPVYYEANARIAIPASPDPLAIRSEHLGKAGKNELVRARDEVADYRFLTEVSAARSLAVRWNTADEKSLRARLSERILPQVIFNEDALVIRVRDLDATEAAAIANEVAARFLSRRRAAAQAGAKEYADQLGAQVAAQIRELEAIEQHIRSAQDSERPALRLALTSGQNLLHSLEAKHQLARIETRSLPTAASLVTPASPDRVVEIRTFWQSMPGLISLSTLAALASFAVSLLLNLRDSRSRAVAALVKTHHLHFAGMAPVAGRSAVSDASLDPAIFEPYREMRNRLLRLPCGECCFLTLLPLQDSPFAAETVTNLACVIADSGRTVLVIDADCRNPRLHPCFDAARHPGLSDFLRGEMRLEETVLKARRPNLWFMPSGEGLDDPGGLFNGRRMSDLIREMRTRFEFILLASPPLEGCSESSLLAGFADYAVLISPFAAHSDRRLREARLALETSDASLAGLMLTTSSPLRLRDQAGRPEPAPLESRNSSK